MNVNLSVTVKNVGEISLLGGGKLEESEGYNYFFVVSYVFESKSWDQLLCMICWEINQFVGQLQEDKSLALHARDLIYFITDLQIVMKMEFWNYCLI